jgi:hypothetical protein
MNVGKGETQNKNWGNYSVSMDKPEEGFTRLKK